MRFDEIDLIGDFKIQGLTGDSGKAIGFSGSNIEWIDAASGGTPANALSTSGYNYIIVEATGTPTENGETLSNVIQNIAPLGTLTDDNRFTVLLMPGTYDMSTSGRISLPMDYIDLVGISSNPYDTIITNPSDVAFRINNLNFGLYNLYFKDCYIDEDGSQSAYMRWKNIVLGDLVLSGSSITSWIGEFEDITILGSCQFAALSGSGDINGIFNNINYIGTGSDGFFTGRTLTGTFSNITSTGDVTTNIFYGSNSISGNFEKIDLNSSGGGCFNTSGNMTGTYRDIKLKVQNTDSFFFASDDANTVFEDIEIGETNASNVFSINSGTFNGKYKNIKIGDAQSCFLTDTGFESTAKFENIQIKSITTNVFSSIASGNLNGTFDNIKIGDVGVNAFYSDSGDLYGTYKDIEVGIVDNFFMVSLNNFVADVENVTVVRINGQIAFHTTDNNTGYTFNAKFSNIKVGQMPSNSFALIFGSKATGDNYNMILENIEVGDISGSFGNSSISATYITASNVTIGNIGSTLFQGFRGTIDNLKVGDVSSSIFQSSNFGATRLSNIKIGNVGSSAFTSTIPNYIYNLEMGNVTGGCFYISGEIPGVSYDTIKVGNVSGNFIVATGPNGGISSNTFRNIKVGNVGDSAFCAFYNSGSNYNSINNSTFNNIEISSANQVFRTNNSGSKVITNSTLDNITIGTCSTIFRSIVGSASVIRNLNVTGQFGTDTYGAFYGRIENSFINQIDRNVNLVTINNLARLERTKYVVHPTKTIDLSGGFTDRVAAYNLFNYATIGNIFGSASNVIDSDVTP